MGKAREESGVGLGKGWIFVSTVLCLLLIVVGRMIFSREAPTIHFRSQPKGIGQSTPLALFVTDRQHELKRVQVELRQGERNFALLDSTLPVPSWWRVGAKDGRHRADFEFRVGRKNIPELQEGRATIHITATNASWGRLFRGGRSELWLDLPVRFAPPQVQVLSFPHYVNQGGSELVVFRVSAGTTESGVEVGSYFFPSWPVKDALPETRLCLFAIPYSVDLTTISARIRARDDAGNETLSSFSYRLFAKRFLTDTIDLTDGFLARVVPPIMSQIPELQDQGSLLKNFLLINGRLRQTNARELIALAQRTSPRFLWRQPFVPLTNAKVEASFAERRTYLYKGQVVDHQDHVGFDLAVTEHIPVAAANDGIVVHAGFFGIYGNTVVIDHGCGLQTLYGHLSSIEVAPGQQLRRGQILGRSGQTGLAGGDHLHFTVLLGGIPVNPVEWWDPHWIHDRIEAKLAAYR